MSGGGAVDDDLPPRANPDLIGHEAAEAAFLDAFGGGRMAHAWLIRGPRGIGKATFAFRAARWVLAGHGRDVAEPSPAPGLFGDEPAPAPVRSLRVDPGHPVFRRVAAAGHLDLMTVERALDEKRGRLRGEIVVEDVRDVGAFLSLTAAEGGWRIVVVDSADEMNRNAANALLKVLEEPPARALLFLVSHNPGRLLPTIRSRCRTLSLRPPEPAAVDRILADRHPDLEPARRATLARLAEGSVGRALALARGGGLDLHAEIRAVLDGLPRLDVAALHALADRIARGGGEGTAFETGRDLLVWWLARIVRAACGDPAASDDDPDGALAGRIARSASLDRWLEVWEKITGLLARADSANLDRKHVILDAFLILEGASRR